MNKNIVSCLAILAIVSAQEVRGATKVTSGSIYTEHVLGVGAWTQGTFQPSVGGTLSSLSVSFKIKGTGTINLTIGTEDFIPFPRPHQTRAISVSEGSWSQKSFNDVEWFGISHFGGGIPLIGNGASLGQLQAAISGSGNVINWNAINPAGTVTALEPGSFSVTYIAVAVSSGVYLDAVTVNGVEYDLEPNNSAPTANSQSVTTDEDAEVGVVFTGSDPDLDTLTYSIVSNPIHGALSGTAPNLTYTPAPNYNGPDSFIFKMNDGALDSATATVSITVNPVNDPPSFTSMPVTNINKNLSYTYNVTASDVDTPVESIVITVLTKPSWLNFSYQGNGIATLSGTPNRNNAGTHSVSLRVSDGLLAVEQNFTLTVTTNNNSPSLNYISTQYTSEGNSLNFWVSGSDPDSVDGDYLTYHLVGEAPSGTSLDGNGYFSWNPSYSQSGTYYVNFWAQDSAGAVSGQQTVTIYVNDREQPTNTPTFTPSWTPTVTRTPTKTWTPVPATTKPVLPTQTMSPPNTPTTVPINTPEPTSVPTPSPTKFPTATASPLPTVLIATPSQTPTVTPIPSVTPTATNTAAPTATPTASNTPTMTATPRPTVTATAKATLTPTPSPRPGNHAPVITITADEYYLIGSSAKAFVEVADPDGDNIFVSVSYFPRLSSSSRQGAKNFSAEYNLNTSTVQLFDISVTASDGNMTATAAWTVNVVKTLPTATVTPTVTPTPQLTATPTVTPTLIPTLTPTPTSVQVVVSSQNQLLSEGLSAIFDNTVKIDWTGATLLPQDVGDHHVYVEVNGKLREYLGRSGSNKFLFWPAVTQNSIAPKFRSGPMVPSRYCLGVAAIKGNPRPWVWSKEVFLLPNSLSALAVIDAASTLTEVKEVDEDLPMDRELMIVADFVRIGFDSQSATTVHWQVSVNGRPWDYLGQSIPTDNFLRWRPGASSIALNYRSGPQFGNTYLFRAAVFQRKGGKRFTIASVPVEFKQQAQKTVQ